MAAYTVEATLLGETSVCVPAYDNIVAAISRAQEEHDLGYDVAIIGDDGRRIAFCATREVKLLAEVIDERVTEGS